MIQLLFTYLLLGNFTVTAYRSTPGQTDASPYRTSINERTNVHGVAVSQDLLSQNGGPLSYGDLVYIDGVGFKFVNDCMAKKHKKHLDIWCETKEQEHAFFKRWKNGKTKVWIVRKAEATQ